MRTAPNRVNLEGQRFGKLTVIERAPSVKQVGRWLCLCDCGKLHTVGTYCLTSGMTKSCGCIKATWAKENKVIHGHYRNKTSSRTYRAWVNMRNRCYRPSHSAYPYYGGKGIKVCDRWLESFQNFLADMGEAGDEMTLDRIDWAGDYAPGNCRWATKKDQARNKSSSLFITFNGETHCVAEWAERLNIDARRIYWRLARGVSPEKAFAA